MSTKTVSSSSGSAWAKPVCVAVVCIAAMASCSSMVSGTHTANTIAPKVAAQAQPNTGTKVIQGYGTGTYEVGTGAGQVVPGRYKCSSGYWARLRNTTGAFDAIIANGIVNGPTTLTVLPTDGAVEFSGTWEWQGA